MIDKMAVFAGDSTTDADVVKKKVCITILDLVISGRSQLVFSSIS